MVALFFKLMIAHAVADFALQSDTMAKGKNWNNKTEPPPGQTFTPTWAYWLTSHALVHAGAVWIVTGNPMLAWIEFALHWFIDACKCLNLTTVHQDQALHVLTKIIYVVILYLAT